MGVPHHIVDSRAAFEKYIVDYLVTGYGNGITPLPCSQCNKAVKFGPMLAYARQELGCDRIATGHYARIGYHETSGRHQLLRAGDRSKDQTYFLYDLSQDVLAHVLFPLGDIVKTETRRIAGDFGLHTADKPESQDLCLVEANGSMQAFLDQYLTPQKGEIVDRLGRVLGFHDGVHHYTIGQRKGLGIAHSEPLYVVELDAAKNRVIVGDRAATLANDCTVQRVNWVSIAEPIAPIRAEVQIRYRAIAVPATIIPLENSRARIVFDDPQSSVTPGQAAVWYEGETLLGGGLIEK
jgi:tRNA-specific 2-thiouridylase